MSIRFTRKMRQTDPIRTAQRRQQIMDAAMQCFKERGFHAASMAMICKAAHMSPGHVYHYFDSKESLIRAIVEEDCNKAELRVQSMLNSANLLESILNEFEHISTDRYRISGVLNAEITAESVRNPEIYTILSERNQRIVQNIVRVLNLAKSKNQIRQSLDSEGFAIVLFTLIEGWTTRMDSCHASPGVDVNQTLREMLSAMLRPNHSGTGSA